MNSTSGEGRDYRRSFVRLAQVPMTASALCDRQVRSKYHSSQQDSLQISHFTVNFFGSLRTFVLDSSLGGELGRHHGRGVRRLPDCLLAGYKVQARLDLLVQTLLLLLGYYCFFALDGIAQYGSLNYR